MSNNNQNNLSWTHRIDEYDILPDEEMPADEVSWKRLQARYPKEKKFNKMIFYWAAAALLVIIILPIALKHRTHEGIQVNNNDLTNSKKGNQNGIEQKNNSGVKITPPENDIKNKALVDVNQLKESKKINPKPLVPVKEKNPPPVFNDSSSLIVRQPNLINLNNDIPALASNSLPDSSNQNKKPAIVHINNLNAGDNGREYDSRKVLKFMRRYDVDAPAKASTGYNKDGSIIKNIN